MMSISFAVLALMFSPLQPASETQTRTQTGPASATVQSTAEAVVPDQQAAAEPETRRVCRFETVIGSNRRTRVCRDVPRQGQQDPATREFMRDSQRVRMPDAN